MRYFSHLSLIFHLHICAIPLLGCVVCFRRPFRICVGCTKGIPWVVCRIFIPLIYSASDYGKYPTCWLCLHFISLLLWHVLHTHIILPISSGSSLELFITLSSLPLDYVFWYWISPPWPLTIWHSFKVDYQMKTWSYPYFFEVLVWMVASVSYLNDPCVHQKLVVFYILLYLYFSCHQHQQYLTYWLFHTLHSLWGLSSDKLPLFVDNILDPIRFSTTCFMCHAEPLF